MQLPDGRAVDLADGILHETASEGRTILWLPGHRDGDCQQWERIGTVPHAKIVEHDGFSSIAATATPARQRVGRSFGQLLLGLGSRKTDRTWVLPGGGLAERSGAMRSDTRLAWIEDEAVLLDEAQIKTVWPDCQEVRAIGRNLFLVFGIEPARAQAAPAPSEDEPARALAERALAAARAIGDPRRVITARADLGLACIYAGDIQRAGELLSEALSESRQLGDRSLECDALSNLALAANAAGQPGRAREFLLPVLAHARASGDHYAEKLALDRLALALEKLGDRAGAIPLLEHARAIAAGLGDLQHEADLCWRAAILHAELGQHDRAIAAAESAIGRLRHLGNPKAEWYAQHLAQFRSGATAMPRAAPASPLGGSIDTAVASTPATSGPGPLRMAITAAKAMARFVGSGFKTTPAESYRERLAACAACAHHTGVRCRICGCITAAKAKLLHERCPAGRWLS